MCTPLIQNVHPLVQTNIKGVFDGAKVPKVLCVAVEEGGAPTLPRSARSSLVVHSCTLINTSVCGGPQPHGFRSAAPPLECVPSWPLQWGLWVGGGGGALLRRVACK